MLVNKRLGAVHGVAVSQRSALLDELDPLGVAAGGLGVGRLVARRTFGEVRRLSLSALAPSRVGEFRGFLAVVLRSPPKDAPRISPKPKRWNVAGNLPGCVEEG